ncbi:2-keto-4-pentenoate hydratase [Pseudonocardia oceani]|uniref:Fumarylacetoacetate hydrolase family protein n=2 Tax=Pseudonocardia oceani TaxID=2792013 RepID=A0ABS6UF62_9PSEU|nr:fumarylacetoacetate hydrolase family protein [Pseudonocardia oceani]MBW0120968.1 fumarylacetoacetate hydrolase family protein [Pseudonocardia oceani]MBW0130875.1 fumarylacetoacetate hydrolase family protein [Pseudonocardia oceani]
MEPTLAALAVLLHRARSERTLLDGTREATGLSLDEAYAVQDRLTALRLGEGRRPVGWKLGYTSAVMREQMGVDAPNHGALLDDMLRDGTTPDGAEAAGHLHPRVEPEIGIVLAHDLAGTDLGVADVAAAVAEVRACLEVVDSIWLDYRFTAAQNTADGSSASGVVVGPVLDVDPAECHAIPVELVGDDGAVLATATSAAAGGHPLLGVAWLAGELAARGRGLRAGELVITGGLTAAVPLRAGHALSARFGAGTAVAVRRPAGETDAGCAPPP